MSRHTTLFYAYGNLKYNVLVITLELGAAFVLLDTEKLIRGEIYVSNFIPPANGASLGCYFYVKI